MWEKLYLFECHSYSGQTERQECFRWLNVSITNRMREGISLFEFECPAITLLHTHSLSQYLEGIFRLYVSMLNITCEHILHTAESAIILALLLWIYHLHHMLMHYIIHSTKPLSSFHFALLHSTNYAMFVVRCTAYECEWGWCVHFSQPVATFRKLPSLITVAYVAMHMNFWSFRNFFSTQKLPFSMGL